MEGSFICLGYQMWKSTGTVQTRQVFEYLGCFWHGCQCKPNRHKPIGNTDETAESVWGDTSEFADNKWRWLVVSIWGCEFIKLLCDNSGLQNELCSHPYVRHSPINIRDALYGGCTEAAKIYYKVKHGRKSVMWMLSVCIPTSVSTASSL